MSTPFSYEEVFGDIIVDDNPASSKTVSQLLLAAVSFLSSAAGATVTAATASSPRQFDTVAPVVISSDALVNLMDSNATKDDIRLFLAINVKGLENPMISNVMELVGRYPVLKEVKHKRGFASEVRKDANQVRNKVKTYFLKNFSDASFYTNYLEKYRLQGTDAIETRVLVVKTKLSELSSEARAELAINKEPQGSEDDINGRPAKKAKSSSFWIHVQEWISENKTSLDDLRK